MTYGEGVNVYLQVHQSRACCNMPELAPNTQQCTVVQILTISHAHTVQRIKVLSLNASTPHANQPRAVQGRGTMLT